MSTQAPHDTTGARRPGSQETHAKVRAVAGVLLLGATAALVSVSAAGGSGVAQPEYPVPLAEVPAGTYTAVCPGPPLLPGNTVRGGAFLDGAAFTRDAGFNPVSSTAKTLAGAMVLSDLDGTLPASALVSLGSGAPVFVLQESTEPSETQGSAPADPRASSGNGLTSRTAGVARGNAVDAPAVFSADPIGVLAPVAGATLTYTADDGDLRGLAAMSCQAPSNDLMILGGATMVGDSSVLVLTNPTETPAVVHLELFGADGPVKPAGMDDQLVAPGESRLVVLAGLAGKQEHLGVRVSSTGGRISAVIQQSVLRGLTPGGIELLAPSAPAATAQVIPGIVIQNADTAGTIREQEGYAAATPSLQVLVPGSSDAVLNVRILGADGEAALPGGSVLTAPAGTVSTIPLDHLTEGNYTVSVTSDVFIAAAAHVSRGVRAGAPTDFGSAPAADRLGSEHAVVLADGVDVQLVFGAPRGRAEVAVTPVRADGTLGDPRIVDLEGGVSVTVPAASLGPDTAAAIVSATGDPVFGAQVATRRGDTPGVSVSAIPKAATGRQSIPVELAY